MSKVACETEADESEAGALKAIGKEIVMRAAADPKQVKVVADVHHTAFGSANSLKGETSRADWKSMNEALDR
eukprot:13522134-Alexandrium_andersonii.AAC.1